MTNGENKRKHLQLVQDVITRMGSNSFLLKGWSISLITAVVGFAVTSNSDKDRAALLLVATGLVAIFWLLDGYYLGQERCYRGLYKGVAKKDETDIDYSLDASGYNKGDNTWFWSMFSKPFVVFYAIVFLVLVFVCAQIIGINIYLK